jgi:hypothetical protein
LERQLHPKMPPDRRDQGAFYRNLWRGQQRLVVAFWCSYVLGFFLSAGAAGLVLGLFTMVGKRLFDQPILGPEVAAGVLLSYCITATVGVWRSANRYPGTRWWPALVKLVVIFVTPVWLLAVVRIIDPKFQIGW